MVKKPEQMLYQERQIRGGDGLCQTLDLMMQEEMKHCRVFTKFTMAKSLNW